MAACKDWANLSQCHSSFFFYVGGSSFEIEDNMAACKDWAHLFQRHSNFFYHVCGFSFEIEDNWYQTKVEFEKSANALGLSDIQKVLCLQLYCLDGLANMESFRYFRTSSTPSCPGPKHITSV